MTKKFMYVYLYAPAVNDSGRDAEPLIKEGTHVREYFIKESGTCQARHALTQTRPV